MPSMSVDAFGALISDLCAALFILGMVSVFAGLLAYRLASDLLDFLLETKPVREFCNRLWLKAREARRDRKYRQSGRVDPLHLFAVLAVALVVLNACASVPELGDDHAIWLEQVKRGGF